MSESTEFKLAIFGRKQKSLSQIEKCSSMYAGLFGFKRNLLIAYKFIVMKMLQNDVTICIIRRSFRLKPNRPAYIDEHFSI